MNYTTWRRMGSGGIDPCIIHLVRLPTTLLAEALYYMQEGRKFDSRWGYWNFQWT